MDSTIGGFRRGVGRRSLGALLGVASLVVLMAVPAHAAPPMISATDQLLVFSIGATTPQSTTITWDVGDEEDAEVRLSTNGGPSVEFADAGSKQFAVEPGTDTYLFCVQEDRDVFACVTVKSSVQLIVPEGDKPDIKLDFDLIHEVTVKPRGYSAEIAFTTDAPTIPAVFVSQKSPLPFTPMSSKDEAVFEPEDVESSSINLFAGSQTSHDNVLSKLDPDTFYHYVIVAHDEATDLWYREKGTFQTLQRNVSVTFDTVKVIDDSDDLSAGDFAFTFFVNGGGPSGWPKTVFSHLGTGSSKTVGVSGTVPDAPSLLDLKVVGYDDDETESPFVLETCGLGAYDFPQSEGESDCGEWTTAQGTFDAGPNADAADPESFTETFTLTAIPQGEDSDVAFKVNGSFSVSFS
jgi:hypothetical protein